MDTFPQFNELPPNTLNAIVAIGIGIGTLYCFLGYRTLRFVIALTGFVLAGPVALVLAAWLSAGHVIVSAIAGAVGGFCGTMALIFLYRAGVFGIGLLAFGLVTQYVLAERPEAWTLFAVVGAGIGGGLLAVLVERPVVTLATAALGSWIVVAGITFFFMGPEVVDNLRDTTRFGDERLMVALSWALLAFAGAAAQFATHRPAKDAAA